MMDLTLDEDANFVIFGEALVTPNQGNLPI